MNKQALLCSKMFKQTPGLQERPRIMSFWQRRLVASTSSLVSLIALCAGKADSRTANHSNTERPFLKHFAPRLAKELNAERENIGTDKEAYNVVVSEVDRDPLEFI